MAPHIPTPVGPPPVTTKVISARQAAASVKPKGKKNGSQYTLPPAKPNRVVPAIVTALVPYYENSRLCRPKRFVALKALMVSLAALILAGLAALASANVL